MDATPYYAPTYFPASYFYSDTVVSNGSPVTGMMPYNAPTYFPPSYFYGASSAIVPVLPGLGYDQSAYAALLALIEATGAFEEVIFGAATQRSQAGADTYPLAVLTPKGWEESDDVDPTSIVRRESFSIIDRGHEPGRRSRVRSARSAFVRHQEGGRPVRTSAAPACPR